MENNILQHRLAVQGNIEKAFDVDFEKGRTGVYADNAENRRLHRVGQQYGHKKEQEQTAGGDKGGKKEEPTDHAKHAAGASDEALRRAAADKNADEKVRNAAKAELEKRGKGGEEKKGGKKDYEEVVERILSGEEGVYNDKIREWNFDDNATQFDNDDKYGKFDVKNYLGYLHNFRNASDKDLQRIAKPTKSWGRPEYVAAIKKAYNEIKSNRDSGDERYQPKQKENNKPQGREKKGDPISSGIKNVITALKTGDSGVVGSFPEGENVWRALGEVRRASQQLFKKHPELANLSVEDFQELMNPDNEVDNEEKYGKSFELWYDATDDFYGELDEWDTDEADKMRPKLEKRAKRAGKDVIRALRNDQGGLLSGSDAKSKIKAISDAAEKLIMENPDFEPTEDDWAEIVNGDEEDLKKFRMYDGFDELDEAIENYF